MNEGTGWRRDLVGLTMVAAPEDVCTSVPQPDGTTVWIRRDGFSVSRPWTTADTRGVHAFHFRADGLTVNLRLDNMISPDPPTYYTPPFEVTDAQLVAVVTAPEVAQIIWKPTTS